MATLIVQTAPTASSEPVDSVPSDEKVVDSKSVRKRLLDVYDQLAISSKIVLMGAAGCGKSTVANAHISRLPPTSIFYVSNTDYKTELVEWQSCSQKERDETVIVMMDVHEQRRSYMCYWFLKPIRKRA